MEPAIKGNLALGSALLATTVIVGGVYFHAKYNNVYPETEISYLTSATSTGEVKTSTSITNTGITKKEGFIDTDDKNAPEILVDEKKIALMPKVEESVDKKDVDKEKNKEELPSEFSLNVPFYSQAPDGKWIQPWKDACEESSVVLSYHFIKGDDLTKEKFKDDILGLVDLQKDLYGSYIDTTVKQTAEILEKYYDYKNYEIIDNPTVEDIKREILEGHPIIAPFAGKKLGNSFFTNGGPRYHMLVIVGYKDGHFITNDVGTSRGKGFAYSYDTIMDSLHDFVPEGKDITTGAKRILVLK